MSLLRLSNIKKSFGAVRALKGVSFELEPGEVHALLGENGAGKSTLIKIITGAHQPDAGEISIDGSPLTRLSPSVAHAHGIAAIYQQPALFPALSVAENIGLALEKSSVLNRVRWSNRRKQAAELLNRVGAQIAPEIEARSLSMPDQQLVEIAKALGAGARILIMDEPTASLTGNEVALLLGLVKKLRNEGTGIIYITHRLHEVFQIATRVTVLRDGESVGTRRVFQSPKTQRDHASLTEAELIRLMVGREISAIFPPSETAPGEALLKLEDVGCAASGISNVSLELRAGEILGLAGLVGAGRTELARVLFGITPADSGKIFLNGKAVTIHNPQHAIAAGIAYVPEDRRRHGIILEMPIASNITMAIQDRIFPAAWLRFQKERELASIYVKDLAIKTPGVQNRAGNLSGGNQQKVALARWLATNPKVLILDEPTQGVDVGAKSEIHKLIRQLAARGMAVLMISSELPEILGMSDRIAVMRNGTIVSTLHGNSSAEEVMNAALLGASPAAVSISEGVSPAQQPRRT
jgi:rhamnose transport system ATP-binding protein